MKKIKAIIFDLDGTLIDSKKDIADSINYMLKQLRLAEKDPEFIASFIGRGRWYLLEGVLGKENISKAQEAYTVYKEHYTKHKFDNTSLYPGVKEVLSYFKGKIKTIVSNRNTKSTSGMLKNFGIYDSFKKVYGGDDQNCLKPKACPINKVIDEMDILKNETIMVGDMDVDILAGKAAGIFTCGVTYGIGKKENLIKTQPDYLVNNIEELKDIIE